MTIDYRLFYKHRHSISDFAADSMPPWDLFISAFNESARVQQSFAAARARQKVWVSLPEYRYAKNELPEGCIISSDGDELSVVRTVVERSNWRGETRACVDITGFTRPHVVVLLEYLRQSGIRKFDAIYGEPLYYRLGDATQFAAPDVVEVRQILGYEGDHVTDTSADLLVIGVGYEDHLIASTAAEKEGARTMTVIGFPSIQPDMYQESILRSQRADESLGAKFYNPVLAPAYDPFITAANLSAAIESASRDRLTNLYLAPLSTKPQALGFALYYQYERRHTAASVIFPFTSSYARDTSYGLARIWRYEVELPS